MCDYDDAIERLIDNFRKQLDPDILFTAEQAFAWLKSLHHAPSVAEQLALWGYYLVQAYGSKSRAQLIKNLQQQGIQKLEVSRCLELLAQLDEGDPCASGELEEAILLAETEAFDRRAQQTPIRRFLEQSRSYFSLSDRSLRQLSNPPSTTIEQALASASEISTVGHHAESGDEGFTRTSRP